MSSSPYPFGALSPTPQIGAMPGQTPPAQAPTPPPGNFFDYLHQSFPNTAPEELPDNAYQAMQEKFFQDHVAPWAMQQGHPLEPLQEGFMEQTKRPGKSEWPRTQLLAKTAWNALAAPARIFPGTDNTAEIAAQEAAKEAARQGINPSLYQFAGESLGTLPYWGAGFGLAGEAAGAAGLSKLGTVITGGIIQGAYDAARAPEGNRFAEGFRGAAIGGGITAGVELLKGLPYFLRSKGVPTEQAAAVGKVATGLATPEEEKLAAEATLSTPKIDEHVTDYMQAQAAGARAAGIPQLIDNDVAPTLLHLDVTGADGKSYSLGPYNEQGWQNGIGRLSEHLQAGGSLDAIRADQATAQKFLKSLEEYIGAHTNTLDLDVPEWGAGSTLDSFTTQRANDTVLAQRMEQEEGVSNWWNENLDEAESARVPSMRGPGYGKPITFGENTQDLPGGGRIVMRAQRLRDSPSSWIAPNGQINYMPAEADPEEWLTNNFPRATEWGQGIPGTPRNIPRNAELRASATPSFKAMSKGWIRVNGDTIEGSSDAADSPNLSTAMQLAGRNSDSIKVRLGDIEGTVPRDQMADFLSSPTTYLRQGGFQARGVMAARKITGEEMPWQDLGREGEPLPIPPTERPADLRMPDYKVLETVKNLYDGGMGIADIADRMGLDYRTVLSWLETNVKEHIPLESLGRNLTANELKLLQERAPEGPGPFGTLDEAKKGRVRGSADVPMNNNGRDETTLNARILANNYDTIRSGDLGRTRETADIIARHNPRAQVFPPDGRFNSWARGEFEGGDPDTARQFSDAIVSDPTQWNTPQPGVSPYSGQPGESFNKFGSRVSNAFGDAFDHMDAHPDELGAIVTHYNPIRFIESQLRTGAPRDATVDFEHYLGNEPDPGAIYHIDPDYTFSKLDPATADPNRKGLDVWRHGETDWNPKATPEARTVERPLGTRQVERLGDKDVDPSAWTERTDPGEHTDITYNKDYLEELNKKGASSATMKGITTHEMVHAHTNNLGVREQIFQPEPITDAIYNGLLKKIGYSRDMANEEGFAYAMQAVRSQDGSLLADLGKADTDVETVLNWFVDKNLEIGDHLVTLPKSLHRDTFLRRLNYTAGQASRSLEDIRRPYAQTHDVGFDQDDDLWYTEDLQNGQRHRFTTREGALNYLEQYQEPLNTPDLLPQDHFPRGFDFAARRLPGPSTARAPLTTDPPSPELQDAEMQKLIKTGMGAMGQLVRPFYDSIGSISKSLDRPDLADTFYAIDDAQVDFNNALRPVEQLMKQTLRGIPDGRRPDLMPYLRATTDAGRDAATAEFRYTDKELAALQRFQSEFPYAGLWDYIQKDIPEMRQNNWDIETRYPRGLDDSMVGDLVRRGRLDPREEDPLKVAGEFARGQAFSDIVKPALDAAQDLLSEDRKGSNDFGMLHPLLQRQLSYLRGNPDWTQQLVMGAVGKAIQVINKVIDGANSLLPERLQLGKMEEGPRDALQKFITFNYAGALALRPALPIRDALQIMLTTYPVLGEKYLWQGMRRAFSGGEDSLGRDAYESGLRNGWMIERSELPEMIAGGDTEGGHGVEGKIEHWTKNALSVISYAHNTNRLVAGWGHTLKLMDALDSFARTGDQDAFIRSSDLWFLNPARRDMLVREAASLTAHPSQWESFAQRAARNLVDATQWNYRRGANPGIYKYQLGRLFGQYGTWPLNYIEYARKFYDAATGPYKAEALKAMFRLGAAHGGVLSAAGAVGIDASHWVFTQPMAYGGGPMFQAVTSIPGTMDFQTYKGTEARRNVIEPFWPGMIPGAEEAHGLWQAVTEGDKGQWQRVLGFSPMGKGDEERGWHKFVP